MNSADDSDQNYSSQNEDDACVEEPVVWASESSAARSGSPGTKSLDDKSRARATRLFEKFQAKAQVLQETPSKISALVDSAQNWTERFLSKLKPDSLEGLTTIFRMVKASVSGEYQGVGSATLGVLIAALLYCVSPIDVIPDAIPVLGLLDDVFVLGLTLERVAGEIQTFRTWERLKTAKSVLKSYIPFIDRIKRVVFCPGWMTENCDESELVAIFRDVFPDASFDYYRWRSNVGWEEARNRVDSEEPEKFEEFLRAFPCELSNVAIFGHSLGARLAVRTLARLAREPKKRTLLWGRKIPNKIGQAFLMGAAIDADDDDLKFAVSGVEAPLCNFFNRTDRVLSYLYRIAEQKSPLGLTGLASPYNNYVDCVVSGEEEYWLDVVKNAASVVTALKSPLFRTKLASAENSDLLTNFLNHQFKSYATFFRNSVRTKGE